MRTFARQAPRGTMLCPRAHRRHSTVSCALRLSQNAPNLVVGARSRFRCARHRRPTGTACLPGRGSDGWRRTIRVNLWMQEKLTGGACIGRLWQIAGTAVQAMTKLHAMTATMATRSTSLHLKSRIRTKCEPLILVVFLTFYSSHFSFWRRQCSAFSVTTTSTSEYIDVPGRECDSIWSANVLAYAYPARGQAPAQTQPSSPTSPAQALLHPWRLLRARASQATITGSPQRRASRAASMFAKLGRLGSRDDGESWICVEVVHTITQRPLRECE